MKRILVIRRDNIGDLVCTLPMIRLLRDRFPHARIDALVNSYNYPVLDKTPLLNNVYQYTKGKHRTGGESLMAVYIAKLRLLWTLRSNRYDIAILPGSGYCRRGVKFARFVGAKQILGFYENEGQRHSGLTLPVDIGPYGKLHEAEYCCGLLRPLGIDAKPPVSELYLSDDELESASVNVGQSTVNDGGGFIGIHISARKPSNRWREAYFVELIHQLWRDTGKSLLLFWSPGPADHPHHPGDDAMAKRILEACSGVPVMPCATARLRELMAGIALCDLVICSDGGAMHIAAGLGKPIICLFGDSNAWQWRPWGVPYRLLQAPDRHAGSIPVGDVIGAYRDLTRSLAASSAYSS